MAKKEKTFSLDELSAEGKSAFESRSKVYFSKQLPCIIARDTIQNRIILDPVEAVGPVLDPSGRVNLNRWENKAKNLIFFAFFENVHKPIDLGSVNALQARGLGNEVLIDLLLAPATDQAEYEVTTQTKVLYAMLFQSKLIQPDTANYASKILTSLKPVDLKSAQSELVIAASFSKSPILLEMLLEAKVNPNAYDGVTGVWAINVARRHKKTQNVELLLKYGARANVQDNLDPL